MSVFHSKTLERIAQGDIRGLRDRVAAAGLWGISVLYAGALRLHHTGYRLRMARRTRLEALVVSIGNLTVGGTGKTTATIAVAQWLRERGHRVAILSRGYRGLRERQGALVSKGAGPLIDSSQAGDEPYMIANTLPDCAVLVGKDRRMTGRHATEDLEADALILDDGFQYQRLEKDIEIVLVDALIPFGYDFLVPRGLLREPPRHLARADAVWITHSDLVSDADLAVVRGQVGRYISTDARIWAARHKPVKVQGPDGNELAPSALRGRCVMALSGIGNPLAFERTLEQLGATVRARQRFPDHYSYEPQMIRNLLARELDGSDVEWIVTTEKDAVRLPSECFELPIWVLSIEFSGMPGEPELAEELSWLLETKAGN